ncbi:MAG: extracellular solute-binding protein [Candidatus Bathyarchaeia archaeon]
MSPESSLSGDAKLKMLSVTFTPEWAGLDFLETLKRGFEETYRDTVINLRYTRYHSLYDEIVAAMKRMENYDIFPVDNIWVPEFVEAGWLADITDYVTDEVKSSFFPEALKSAEYPASSGRYYGLPWYIDTKYLFYNKTMLSKAGIKEPPKTLDELWNQALILKRNNIAKHPIVWSWAQQECLICDYTILTTLFGGRLVDENGKPAFHEGGGVKALEWMVESISTRITGWESLAFAEPDVARVFGDGDSAFAFLWLSSYEVVNSPQRLAGVCGIAPIPGSDILPEGVSVNGSMLFGVSPKCENKEAAVELIKFWSGLGSGKSYVRWLFPIWMRLFDAPKMFQDGIYDILDVVKYQYAHMIIRPRIPKYALLSKELQRAVHEALTKAKTPQEALNDAARRFMSH